MLEEYRFYIFETEDGVPVIGRVLEDDGENLHIVTALLNADDITILPKDEIVARHETRRSLMPSGLLVTLTAEEVLDLLRFLQSSDD